MSGTDQNNEFDTRFDNTRFDNTRFGDSNLDSNRPLGFAAFNNNDIYNVGEDDNYRDCIDIDQLIQRIDLYNAEVTALLINLNLQEIQQADQYNDNTLTAPTDLDLYTIPTTTFSEVDTDTGTDSGTNTNTEIPIRIPIGQAFQSDDESELIPQYRSSNKDPLLFAVALGLQYNKASISRLMYISLLEILRILGLAVYINNLLAYVSTLKKQTIAYLLLIAIRKRKIILQSIQQSR